MFFEILRVIRLLLRIVFNISLVLFFISLGMLVWLLIAPTNFYKYITLLNLKLLETTTANNVLLGEVKFANDTIPVSSKSDDNQPESIQVMAQINNIENKYKLYKDFKFQDINAYLIIDSINVEGPIISGTNEHIMEKGFWHVNINGGWLEGGNVVIFGHRFYHLPPAKDTFFNLDKIKKGDTIIIKTDLGIWQYKVVYTKVVSRYDTSIFKNTDKPTITLVTCHPLWTSKQRFIVKGILQTSIITQ